MRIVAAATAAERRGFVLLTGTEAASPEARHRIIEAAGPDARAIGIEVVLGDAGVVRVALPRDGRIYCTWVTHLDAGDLIERICVLPPATQRELDIALQLSGTEAAPGPS